MALLYIYNMANIHISYSINIFIEYLKRSKILKMKINTKINI